MKLSETTQIEISGQATWTIRNNDGRSVVLRYQTLLNLVDFVIDNILDTEDWEKLFERMDNKQKAE